MSVRLDEMKRIRARIAKGERNIQAGKLFVDKRGESEVERIKRLSWRLEALEAEEKGQAHA